MEKKKDILFFEGVDRFNPYMHISKLNKLSYQNFW